MPKKVLLYAKSTYCKRVILRYLVDANYDFIEASNINDILLKFQIFEGNIYMFLHEVDSFNYLKEFEAIRQIKNNKSDDLKFISIIPEREGRYIKAAQEAGVDDVLLINKNPEEFVQQIKSRIDNTKMEKENIEAEEIIKDPIILEKKTPQETRKLSQNQILSIELKRAKRGGYPLSMILCSVTGMVSTDVDAFESKVREEMRDTDQLVRYSNFELLTICPFTIKTYLIEVEKKIRNAYEKSFGSFTKERRLFLYGATFPEDESDIEKLLILIQDGVHDLKVLNSIREPLNEMSSERLNAYKKMLRIYK